MEKYSKFKFTKYDYLYENLCEYISLYLRGEAKHHLFNYLKQKLITQNSLFYDFIIKDIALKEFVEIGLQTSKYKETLKYNHILYFIQSTSTSLN